MSNKQNLIILSVLAITGAYSYLHGLVPWLVAETDNSVLMKREKFDSYFVDHVSLEEFSDQGRLYSIEADEVTHRNRKFMGLATYQNLKEIYISNFRLDAYVNNGTLLHGELTTSIRSLASRPYTNGKNQRVALEDRIAVDSNVDDLDILTRILFDGINVNLHHSANKKSSIMAKTGRINLGNESLVLEEGVRFITADKKEIQASLAVWSNEYNGIYFPKGYLLEKQHMGMAFFTINEEGGLSEASVIPKIAYTDLIAERERSLYEQSARGVSPYMRAILGMPIQN